MYRLLFIVNPKSGTKKKEKLIGKIREVLKSEVIDFEIVQTQYAGHAKELASNAVKRNLSCIVAIGGDGTVNEVGTALIGSRTTLGIIPCGSGNGLARSLGISLNPIKALKQILSGNTISIDTINFGNHKFLNIAGMGFDARIAHAFANHGKRGLTSYIVVSIAEYFKYRPLSITIKANGQNIHEKPFVISFANSGQFGNNAYISPRASLTDGLIDISIIKPFPLYAVAGLVFALFTKRINKSKYYTSMQASKIKISSITSNEAHIDGEPIHVGQDFYVSIRPKSLKVICGNSMLQHE
ncbi:MAG: diacylglycerol kinase family protein [Bacteroidota bacterium]|nr:diacylglycerol kinase family protein [Bacteroidota bacterium]